MPSPRAADLLYRSSVVRAPLARRHADVLGLYERIAEICDSYVFAEGRLQGVLAVGFLDNVAPHTDVIRYPLLLASSHFVQDKKIQKMSTDALQDELTLGVADGIVGALLTLLVAVDGESTSPISSQDRELLVKYVKAAATGPIPYISIPKPHTTFPNLFDVAWDTPTVEPACHIICPVVLETFGGNGGPATEHQIGPALALDLAITPNELQVRKISEALRLIQELIRMHYLVYCSRLTWPPQARKALSLRWKWADEGRVFGPLYLDRLEDALETRSSSMVPGASEGSSRTSLLSMERAVVVYCDGNGIKSLNDRHTHILGNEVIRIFGSVLSAAAQKVRTQSEGQCINEVVIRWGGDEFIVILGVHPSCSDDSIRALVNGLQKEVRNLLPQAAKDLNEKLISAEEDSKSILGDQPLRNLEDSIGIAMGWAEWQRQKSGRFADVWSNKAEQAMYVAKEMMRFYRELRKRRIAARVPGSPVVEDAAASTRDHGKLLLLATAIGYSELDEIQGRLEARAHAGSVAEPKGPSSASDSSAS